MERGNRAKQVDHSKDGDHSGASGDDHQSGAKGHHSGIKITAEQKTVDLVEMKTIIVGLVELETKMDLTELKSTGGDDHQGIAKDH